MPRPQDPMSQESLIANRDNVARSGGPRTPQGMVRFAQDARKHRFTASASRITKQTQFRGQQEQNKPLAHHEKEPISAPSPATGGAGGGPPGPPCRTVSEGGLRANALVSRGFLTFWALPALTARRMLLRGRSALLACENYRSHFSRTLLC